MTKNIPLHILLVDDDATDRELFIEGLSCSALKYTTREASNGEEALAYLKSDEPKPNVVILDLNMPIKDGRETLKELKADPALRNLPVFILSTSNAHFDVSLAYGLGANLFLVKPHDFTEMLEMIRSVFTVLAKYTAYPPVG